MILVGEVGVHDKESDLDGVGTLRRARFHPEFIFFSVDDTLSSHLIALTVLCSRIRMVKRTPLAPFEPRTYPCDTSLQQEILAKKSKNQIPLRQTTTVHVRSSQTTCINIGDTIHLTGISLYLRAIP